MPNTGSTVCLRSAYSARPDWVVNWCFINVTGSSVSGAGAAAERGVNRVFSTMDDMACAETLAKIASLVVGGEIALPPIREFPLSEVAEVHRMLETGHNRGKMVLKVADW
jgi:NADPH2:quinone reductase